MVTNFDELTAETVDSGAVETEDWLTPVLEHLAVHMSYPLYQYCKRNGEECTRKSGIPVHFFVAQSNLA
jgi:hypothetical protein